MLLTNTTHQRIENGKLLRLSFVYPYRIVVICCQSTDGPTFTLYQSRFSSLYGSVFSCCWMALFALTDNNYLCSRQAEEEEEKEKFHGRREGQWRGFSYKKSMRRIKKKAQNFNSTTDKQKSEIPQQINTKINIRRPVQETQTAPGHGNSEGENNILIRAHGDNII